jgi:hypothetical protein
MDLSYNKKEVQIMRKKPETAQPANKLSTDTPVAFGRGQMKRFPLK